MDSLVDSSIIDFVSNIYGKQVIAITMLEEHIKLSPVDNNVVDCVNVLYEAKCSDDSTYKVICVTSETSQMIIPATPETMQDAFER